MSVAPPLRRSASPRTALVALATAALAGAVGGLGVHLALPQSRGSAYPLPELHGQAVWPPRTRPAPVGALRDLGGRRVSPAGSDGRTTLLAFVRSPLDVIAVRTVVAEVTPSERPRLLLVPAAVQRQVPDHAWGSRPGVYLIDAAGFERTAYGYPFQPAFLARDLATLAEGR